MLTSIAASTANATEAISAASDADRLACLDASDTRMQVLRDAGERISEPDTVPDITSLLAPPPAASGEPA